MSTNISTKKNIRGWGIVVVSFLTLMILFATAVNCMGVFLKPVSEDFGIERTTFTITITIHSLAMLISSVAAGRLMERMNVKGLMATGVAAAGISMFLFATAPSIYFFYIAAAITGTSISFACNIPIAILIRNWFPENKVGLAMGIALVGTGAGSMILNPLYTWIITTYGWRYAFGTAGTLLIALVLPLILIVIKEKPSGNTGNHLNGNAVQYADSKKYGLMLGDALRRPVTWIMFIGFILTALINMTFLAQGVAYLTDSGFDPAKAANIIAVGSGMLIIGTVLIGFLDGKLGTRKATLIALVFLMLAFVAFYVIGLTGSLAIIIMYIIFYGLGAPVATVSMPMIVSTMYGNRDYGSIFGFFCMTAGIGGMLQSIISMVYDVTGSYLIAWVGMTALGIVAIIIYMSCIRQVKEDKNE